MSIMANAPLEPPLVGGRRPRAARRHEQLSIAMAVAAVSHHSAPRSERPGKKKALRGQKTATEGGHRSGVLTEPEPHGRGASTDGYVAAPVPSLAVPLLACAAGEVVDSSSLQYLTAAALRQREEGKKELKELKEFEEAMERALAQFRKFEELCAGERGRRRGSERLPKLLPLVASHIVDNGSGVSMAGYCAPEKPL